MKHALIYIATIFLLAACGQEELPSGEGVGYLSLENIQLQAAEEEIIQTRAVDNDLYVQIDDGTPYSPGNAPSTIELSAGTYTLRWYDPVTTELLREEPHVSEELWMRPVTPPTEGEMLLEILPC